jgi:hypothetical protein
LQRRRPGWLRLNGHRSNGLGFLVLTASDLEVALPLALNPDGTVVATTAKPRSEAPRDRSGWLQPVASAMSDGLNTDLMGGVLPRADTGVTQWG